VPPPAPPPGHDGQQGSPAETAIALVIAAGCLLTFTGVAVGLRMALKRKEAPCPDGTFFPEGTKDFRCFVHPHGLDGTAVVVFSLMLGILIVLAAVITRNVIAGTSPASAAVTTPAEVQSGDRHADERG
jgi:hypothetical protein